MAFSKAHRFNPSDYHYSLICRAISHPARLAIIRKLYHEGRCEVKGLIKGMPISQAAASQHLRILREMHIISCEQVYPTVWYWLNADLPSTYETVIDLVMKAGTRFDNAHTREILTVGRIARASALGI